MRRALAALGVVIVVTVGAASPASAHAVLVASSPADRAHLDTPPSVVTLTFSENISASLGAVKVFDSDAKRVDNGNLEVRNNVVSLGFQEGLGDGGYIVTYRVISADSHPVAGAFTFSVGAGQDPSVSAIASVFDEGGDKPWHIAGAVVRWFAYGGTLLAAGGVLFLIFAHDGGTDLRLLRRVVRIAAVVGAAGVLAGIPIQAALATGLGITAFTKSGVLGDVLADGVGLSIVLELVGLAAIAVVSRRLLALLGAAVATGAFAFAGHTTDTSPKAVATLGDIVHVWAAAAWFGGIVLLALVLRTRRSGPAVNAAHVVVRFSRLATVAVIVVGVAGSVLAWTEVRAVKALTSTTYGWLVIAKVAAVGVVAALGAYNHYRLVPALEAAPRKAAALLRRTVSVEAVVLVGVIALAAVLVNVTPARTAAGLSGIFSKTMPLGDGSLNIVVDPNRKGPNVIHLYVLDKSGRNTDVEEISVELSLPSNDIGPIDRTPFAAGPGHYQVDGVDLPIAGTWTAVVKARISKFEQKTATIEVPVNP